MMDARQKLAIFEISERERLAGTIREPVYVVERYLALRQNLGANSAITVSDCRGRHVRPGAIRGSSNLVRVGVFLLANHRNDLALRIYGRQIKAHSLGEDADLEVFCHQPVPIVNDGIATHGCHGNDIHVILL